MAERKVSYIEDDGATLIEAQYHANGVMRRKNTYQRNCHKEETWFSSGNKYSKSYKKNGILHRVNGPALTYFSSSGVVSYDAYYLNGLLHNPIGPAVIEKNPYCSIESGIRTYYWLRGINIQKDKFMEVLTKRLERVECL